MVLPPDDVRINDQTSPNVPALGHPTVQIAEPYSMHLMATHLWERIYLG